LRLAKLPTMNSLYFFLFCRWGKTAATWNAEWSPALSWVRSWLF